MSYPPVIQSFNGNRSRVELFGRYRVEIEAFGTLGTAGKFKFKPPSRYTVLEFGALVVGWGAPVPTPDGDIGLTYDIEGRLTTVTSESGKVTTLSYSVGGQLLSTTTVLGGVTTIRTMLYDGSRLIGVDEEVAL